MIALSVTGTSGRDAWRTASADLGPVPHSPGVDQDVYASRPGVSWHKGLGQPTGSAQNQLPRSCLSTCLGARVHNRSPDRRRQIQRAVFDQLSDYDYRQSVNRKIQHLRVKTDTIGNAS
jgi:hypothetical protein